MVNETKINFAKLKQKLNSLKDKSMNLNVDIEVENNTRVEL